MPAPWYSTGTVTVTNGSTAVTGVGTDWVNNAAVGNGFQGPDGFLYQIADVVSATQINLARPYNGSTASAQAYSIAPLEGYQLQLAQQVATLITQYQGVVSNAGAGKFVDGTLSAPSIRSTVNQSTGVNILGLTVALVVSGVAALTASVDDVAAAKPLFANAGMTVNGSASVSGALSVTGATTLTGGATLGASTNLAWGSANNAIAVSGGNLLFYLGGPERVRINSSGNVGIGTNSPVSAGSGFTGVDVRGSSGASLILGVGGSANFAQIYASTGYLDLFHTGASAYLAFSPGGGEKARVDASGNFGLGTGILAPPAGYRLLALDNTAGAIVSFRAGGTEISQVFGDTNGQVYVVNGARVHRWTSNAIERMRIDINGNFLVNTSTAYARMAVFRNDGGTALYCGAYGAPGAPSLSVSGTTPNGTLIEGHNQNSIVMFRVDGGGQVTNFSGGYGQISDRKHKIEESITPASSQWADIKALAGLAVNFKLKADPTGPTLLGWIAQDVEPVCPYLISEAPDYETVEVPELDMDGSPVLGANGAPVTKSVNRPNGEVTKTIKTSVAYMKALVALGENMARTEVLEGTVGNHQERITTLEAKVAALEAQLAA